MIAHLLNRLFQRKDIVSCDRELYLQRWYLFRSERLGVFLHHFVRSDEDRALHDHPWSFLVVPLWRGYIEHSECSMCRHPPTPTACLCPRRVRVYPLLGTRFRRGTYRHRVELIDGKPSWSLFFRFREHRTWGFWLPTGFMAWNRWWQEKCE